MPSVPASLLTAGVIAAFVGVFGIFFTTFTEPTAKMELVPQTEYVSEGESFSIHVMVESDEPANVFAGEIQFDSNVLEVDAINYNTSIADLWAERPWYSNGAGTINFGGGTTQGGFTGRGELIKITFQTLTTGNGSITIVDPRILRHDGTGSDIALEEVIDAVVYVENEVVEEGSNLVAEPTSKSTYAVIPKEVSTDLNKDGKQSLADISIFMMNIASNDPRYDFNGDGKVNTSDLAILLSKE